MSGLHDWFQTPAGQVALAWERARLDDALADVFGYHALQLGLAELDALAANRMPHRWLADVAPPLADPSAPRVALVTDSTALPFAEASLDLVALPHTLELSVDPHAALREVYRVLVPEGRTVISGLNPWSLWGLRQGRARLYQRLGGGGQPYLPDVGEFISPGRLRDWLRLLGFELETISFGCYRPAATKERWLQRHAWMESLGARWWPILGAGYVIVAAKRVPGMRLLEPSWRKAPRTAGAQVQVARRH